MGDIKRAAELTAQWWTDKLQQGDKEVFFVILRDIVHGELAMHGRCKLSCDYDPDKHLIDALRAAGVDCRGVMFSAHGILPENHLTITTPDRIKQNTGDAHQLDDILI